MTQTLSSWEDAVRWLREQPDQQELVRGAYYDDPLAAAAHRYWSSAEWMEIRRFIGERSGKALDVGAGRGIASYALAKDGFLVTSLEPDPSDLVGGGAIRALAAEQHLPITVEQNVSESLPFDDATFDVIFARAVLHHTSDLNAAMREFARVLKPGGLFLAVREHVITRDSDLPAFLDLHPLHNLYGGENAFRADVYLAAIRASGLRLVSVLKPLESAINYAPHDRAGLHREISQRFGRIPGLPMIARAVLGMPGLGRAAIALAGRFDNRPGRLYSFVAVRGH